MIGAAGVFLYDHLIRQKRRLILQQDVMRLGMSVNELQREVEAIRENQALRRRRRRTKSEEKNSLQDRMASVSEADPSETDMMSVVDDDLDDEFFDFSDDEDFSSLTARVDSKALTVENQQYKDIDAKLSSPEMKSKEEALDELQKLLDEKPKDPEILWRMAKANHGIGMIKGITEGLDSKKQYIERAVELSTECLAVAPRLAESHKWYAICIGSRGEFQPTKDKIKDGFVFKEHVEEALNITPEDPTLLHLLGRFRFEVATLSWFERKMANTIYGEVPYATFPEAIEPLKKVEELKQEPWMENRLLLAKCFIKMGEYSEAVHWLDKCVEIIPQSVEDAQFHQEASQLLQKHEGYRKK
ncbi:family with sequence similarity 82, member [Nesidiocoris tenuis]|nr:family with sequence similarity 82, member [Nesidiocoris tenuis]